MKLICLSLTLCLTLFSNTSFSAKIEACDTAKCQQYFKQYKKFARYGYADAMSALGEFYYHGYGTEKDLVKSLSQFKKAAKYGSFIAPLKAGLLYLNEPSLKDIDQSIKYLRKAARNNHPDAELLLGMIYYSKSYGKRDLDSADKYLTRAYNFKHQMIEPFIDYLRDKQSLSKENFPSLSQAILDKPLMKMVTTVKVNKQEKPISTHFPVGDMEVISVSGPTLSSIFEQQFEMFAITTPDKVAGTGTRILGRKCDQSMGCGTVDKEEFKRLMNHLRD